MFLDTTYIFRLFLAFNEHINSNVEPYSICFIGLIALFVLMTKIPFNVACERFD